MWRDRWFAVGVVGTLLACVACLTPVAALVLGAIGLGAWTGRLDVALLPLLAGFAALAVYRYWAGRRRTQ
jgi:mercuric ion transport protein